MNFKIAYEYIVIILFVFVQNVLKVFNTVNIIFIMYVINVIEISMINVFKIVGSETSTPMFLRPSLLPSSSSFNFGIGERKPDTPRPTSKSFCLNPSRLSLNTSISARK